jgi:hypothetical protein
MLTLWAGLFLSTLNVVPVSAAEQAPRDARDLVPAALIGPWKADLKASTFAANPPRAQVRTFQYTADGRVLVTFYTVTADGNYVTGHWAAYADGSPSIEYHNSQPSIPYNVVALKKINDTTLTVTATRYGKVNVESQYVISPDGQTLTYTFGKNVTVYRRWDKMD